MESWTTRVLPEYTRPFGVEEVHNVWFVPRGWPGKGPNVGLLIPECELHYTFLSKDGEPVSCINRPTTNKNVKHWLRYVCEIAAEQRICLTLACDTAKEAERFAKIAARLLPGHERAAIERMYAANSRVRNKLS
jgi:hypothetical protein